MRLLVLGGTRFLGRHLVETAVDRGWEVTIFHRGTTPNPYAEVAEILGDRTRDLDRLHGRWDAAVDTCGYMPPDVDAAAAALRDRVERYAFVSSVSVYPDDGPPRVTEDSPRRRLIEPVATFEPARYGELKAGCEDALRARFGADALIVRPGLIVGPWDYTDRFGYWVRRVARGGRMLVPRDGAWRIPVVDARDLAAFVLDRLAAADGETYDVPGAQPGATFAALLDEIARIAGSSPEPVWADPDWLLAQNVAPWSELPLWAPDFTLLERVTGQAARRAGLQTRPLAATIADTLAWEGQHAVAGAALAPEREAELLRALG